MAEKAFKVPSLALVGSENQLAVNTATSDLWWGINALATQYYVDSAVSNVSVNVEAIAGNGLGYNLASGDLKVNPGFGIALISDEVIVNTNALAGDGLTGGFNNLAVNPGFGIAVISDAVIVNTNALAGTGLAGGFNNLSVNTDVIATKAYVDAATAGLNVHDSVKYATTAGQILDPAAVGGSSEIDNITLSALSNGDRVLIKNATDAAKNGVYTWSPAAGLTRAADYNSVPEVDAGDFIFVENGTVNGKTGWVQTNTITTLGTDAIEFTQFSGAGTYVAGNGLTLNGNQFDVGAGFGIFVQSDAVAVNTNALAGDGLTGGYNNLAVNPGAGIYITGDAVAVNVNALYDTNGPLTLNWQNLLDVNVNAISQSLVTSWGAQGLYRDAYDTIGVNNNAIAGSGLTPEGFAGLAVNPGFGVAVVSDQVIVNTNALAGDGLTGGFNNLAVNPGYGLYVGSDYVSVNNNAMAGSGLTTEGFAGLAVNPGFGIAVSGNAVTVNSAALAGNGLSYSPIDSALYVSTGFGVAVVSDEVIVNTNALAGDGLTGGFNNLAVNPGFGIAVISDAVIVNTNALAGTGLAGGFNNLSVNTDVIATKTYVDGLVQGLDVKEAVAIATTADITLSGEGVKEDGQSYPSGLRVLVKNQSNASDNGIYTINKNGAWPRTSDFDLSSSNSNTGSFVFVQSGTNAGKGFVYSSANTWTQFSEAGSLTAGTGIYISSNQIYANTNAIATNLAGTGLYVANGDDLVVNTNAIATDLAGTGLYVANGDDLAVNVNALATSFINLDFAAKTLSIRSAGGEARSLAKSYYATTTTSNTYVTVGTLDFSNVGGSCVLDIDLLVQIPDSSGIKTRSSKLSGVFYTIDDTSEYTEYAICEKNGAASDFDVKIEGRDIKVKATFSNSYGTLVAIAKAVVTGTDV